MKSADVLDTLARGGWRAHRAVFGWRHEESPALFHPELVEDFWSDAGRMVILGFRGAAKSTIAEEYVALAARQHRFRCAVFVGPNEARAADRLNSVVAELKLNDRLVIAYGPAHFDIETQTRIALRGGPVVLAMGRDQDVRGLKQGQDRPDLVIVDDFEDEENVLTPEGRRKTLRRFLREWRLACHPRARYRVLATVMDRDCVPLQLGRAGWPVKRYPVTYLDAEGVEAASWPARFPLAWVERERAEYQRHGEAAIWAMEMACEEGEAAGPGDFKREYFSVRPRVRTYEPVYVMIDPARAGRDARRAGGSATGVVVFSWVGHELVVWEDRTGFYRPSEMIALMYELDDQYHPVAVGFEEVGLEEWALEPIRAEGLRRGQVLPLRPLRAPRDKLAFIRGLEPHARSGEIVLARELPELVGAFASFPRGRIDAPNALAYALVLRPGLPVYDEFRPADHVVERVFWPRSEPLYLAMGAADGWVAGVLLGHAHGKTAILGDWVREGEAGAVAGEVVRECGLLAAQPVSAVVGPEHFNQWRNTGLVQALGRVPVELRQGGPVARGRDFLRRQLAQNYRAAPAVEVAARARWTLAALSGGYAVKVASPGSWGAEPERGVYRVLGEALEATLALAAVGAADEASSNWSFTPDGRRYRRYTSAFERRVH